MTILMYDSDNPLAIPADVPAVAGYVDLWPAGAWARFPTPHKVRIARFASTNDGDALDIEARLATPAQAPGWVRMRQAAGIARPKLYVNRGNWQAVKDAVAGLDVLWWVSTLDGTLNVPGADAVQYCGALDSNDPCRSDGHYDLSLCSDAFFGVAAMTDTEVTALFADWYVVYAGRFPNDADRAEIANHWLPAWRADPVQARHDFGLAAATEVGGKDVRPVRHFEQDAALAALPAAPKYGKVSITGIVDIEPPTV